MNLEELIAFLSKCPPKRAVAIGFGNPHSYRGYYYELAFETVKNTTVGAMLACAQESIGKTFTGYKGGEFEMKPWTNVWLSEYGCTGEGIGPVLLQFMVGDAK